MRRKTGSDNGVPSWTVSDTFSGRLFSKSRTNHTATGQSQNYDAQCIVSASQTAFENAGQAWQVKVLEYKARLEKTAPDGPPELKRTRYFRLAGVGERLQGQDGREFLQILELINDSGQPTW